MVIGKIIKSNAHHDYVCQIYAPGEVTQPPEPVDYRFGTFVGIQMDNGRSLIGLIYDTILLNPEYGRFGPRLSPASELTLFAPDYLREKATVTGIVLIGMMGNGGDVAQGIPALAAPSDAPVERLGEDRIRTFHQGEDAIRLSYLPTLLTLQSPLSLLLAQAVLVQLRRLFPEYRDRLLVIQQQLNWQSQISPLAG